MKKITIPRDNAPDLIFTGEMLGAISNKSDPDINCRWIELTTYRTEEGRYICHKEEITQWQGERNRNYALVFDEMDKVISFLEDQ